MLAANVESMLAAAPASRPPRAHRGAERGRARRPALSRYSNLSQREIGARLYLSLNTVKTHTRELYRKLGVHSRSEAVACAATPGLLDSRELST